MSAAAPAPSPSSPPPSPSPSQTPAAALLRETVRRVVGGARLTRAEAAAAFGTLMTGEAPPPLVAALLTALAVRGEAAAELAGAADALRSAAVPFDPGVDTDSGVLVDTCGTGGDGSGSFNISTAAAVVAAAAGKPAGLRISKHGNRSASSLTGSADVLAELGVRIDAPPAVSARCLRELGIAFLLAPVYHPAMRHVGPVRRELGFPTVFNLVGPLANPVLAARGPKSLRQVIGCRADRAALMAEALRELGTPRAMVVSGRDGLDEVSPCALTLVRELRDGAVRETAVDPRELGLPAVDPADLRAATPRESAAAVRDALSGRPGPRRTAVVLNAAAALLVGDAAPDWPSGLALSAEAIDSGRAADLLRRWAEMSSSA